MGRGSGASDGQIGVKRDEDARGVTFRLEGVDGAVADLLTGAGWTMIGERWEKVFPPDAIGLEHVKRNLPRLAAGMLEQMPLAVQPWEAALETVAGRAEAAGLRWWLTGSGAAAIRVPGIEPHDLDIMLDEAQLELAAETFADVLVEPIIQTGGWVTRAFGVIFPGMRVDLAAGGESFVDEPEPVDFGPWAEAHLETVSWRGYEVRVPPLSVQASVNRRRGRLERAALIEAALAEGDSLA